MPDKPAPKAAPSLSTVSRGEIVVLALVMAVIAGSAMAFALFA